MAVITYCDKHHIKIRKWQSIQAWGNLKAAEWANLSCLPSLKPFVSSLISEGNDSKNSTKIINSSGIFKSLISRTFSENLFALFGFRIWCSCLCFQIYFFLRTRDFTYPNASSISISVHIQKAGSKNKDTSL